MIDKFIVILIEKLLNRSLIPLNSRLRLLISFQTELSVSPVPPDPSLLYLNNKETMTVIDVSTI